MLEHEQSAAYSRQWCESSRFLVQVPSQGPFEGTKVGEENSSILSYRPFIIVLILWNKLQRGITFPTCSFVQGVHALLTDLSAMTKFLC